MEVEKLKERLTVLYPLYSGWSIGWRHFVSILLLTALRQVVIPYDSYNSTFSMKIVPRFR